MTTREFEGAEVPQAGTYEFDPAHTRIDFVGRHMMITKVRGTFGEFSGRIVIDEDPLKSYAETEIASASLSTNSEQRDAHLRSPDFLDVESFPTITFRSTSLSHEDGNRWKAVGDLTIRDVTKPVTLDVEFEGAARNPDGQAVVFFSGRTEFDRESFGMTWNQALEAGGWLVSKKVIVEIEAQAALQAAQEEVGSAVA